MKHRIYWFDETKPKTLPRLKADTQAEVVIVGGGMAGLSAAQWLRERDIDTLLLESHHCGAGASGHNSGTILADAFTDTHNLLRFGVEDATLLAHTANEAVRRIGDTSKHYGFDCDRTDNDTLYLATNAVQAWDIRREHASRQALGLASTYYDRHGLRELLGSTAYHAGIGYGSTLGMNSLKYVLGLRDALVQQGLRVHEQTPVLGIAPGKVTTAHATVKARHVLVCVDRFAPSLGIESRDVHHQQHFLAVSEPLDEKTRHELFPRGPRLVHGFGPHFHYFRLTPDGRLVVGGMMMHNAYGEASFDPSADIETLVRLVRHLLPALRDVGFTHGWGGLFGLTKDMMPIAGRLPGARSGAGELHAAMCAGSMGWSFLAGQTAAQIAIQGDAPLARFFAPGRAYTPLDPLTSPLRKSVAFPIANLYSSTLLKGDPAQVARHQRWVRMGTWAVAAGAALLGGSRWLSARHGRARRSPSSKDRN